MVKAWSNSFTQITVFCHPIPCTGAFVHRNVRKVFHLSLTSLELDNYFTTLLVGTGRYQTGTVCNYKME